MTDKFRFYRIRMLARSFFCSLADISENLIASSLSITTARTWQLSGELISRYLQLLGLCCGPTKLQLTCEVHVSGH